MNSSAPIDQVFQSVIFDPNAGFSLLFLGVKAFVLFGLFFFIVFGVVMVRQISLMSKSVETALSPFLRLIGYAYLLASILIWIFAFSTL